MKKEKTWVKKVLLLGIILAAVLVYILVPPVNSSINRVMKMFASGDFDVVREFVASYGAYAALASFLLMIFQSVAAPLPAFLLTLANANLFGWWQGAILSWSSAMAGAAVCFFIARILGRDAAERLTSKAGIAQIDTFFEKYGRNTILICRLLPFISFDIVSYAAGLTSMSFGSFFLATGIGQLPATIVYSYVGGMLTGGAQLLMTGLLILFALSALVVMLRKIYMDREKLEQFLEEARNLPGCRVLLSTLDGYYTDDQDEAFQKLVFGQYKGTGGVTDDLSRYTDQCIKVSLYGDNGSQGLREQLYDRWKDVFSINISGEKWLDINSPEATKGGAVRYIQNELRVTPAETVVFGDNFNDISMLKCADRSYAPAGSAPEVRAAARYEVDSYKEDGVLQVLKQLLEEVRHEKEK